RGRAPASAGRGSAAALFCRYRSSDGPAQKAIQDLSALMSWHASGARLRCGLDSVDNGLIARTAAIIAGKMLANLLPVRRWRLIQQILRRHQHSRRTESALQRVAFPECRLQIGNLAAVG